MSHARVMLWGRQIGAVLWDEARGLGVFSYAEDFVRSQIQLAPFEMPLREGPFDFPALTRETFKGLPGLLADSLPDKFGNALIDRWLTEEGKSRQSFDPVQRLCYVGTRGMGALEFQPESNASVKADKSIELEPLIQLANRVLTERGNLAGILRGEDDRAAMKDILRVGTSAGGARAKALLAWNEQTGEFRSGQLPSSAGFSQWLIKFDGVTENGDKEVADPLGYGRLEYACYLLARSAGVDMSESRLFEEGGRAHFMTRRFDRTDKDGKLHMQSLCALRHFDFNHARAYSYEQAIETIRLLKLGRGAQVEMVRRALLNILIRNQDDHTKNIGFLMGRDGRWSLAPAFDVVYAYNPAGSWTSQHQMSLNKKTDGFTIEDLMAFGQFADLKPREIRQIINELQGAISKWSEFCAVAGVSAEMARTAAAGFRDIQT